jgi:hypothetical protein
MPGLGVHLASVRAAHAHRSHISASGKAAPRPVLSAHNGGYGAAVLGRLITFGDEGGHLQAVSTETQVPQLAHRLTSIDTAPTDRARWANPTPSLRDTVTAATTAVRGQQPWTRGHRY